MALSTDIDKLRELGRLRDDYDELKEEISDVGGEITKINQTLAAHEVRFGNGREVMAEMKTDITSLKPKAPDWLKLLGVGVGLLGMTLGAHYWLIEQLNERPTSINVEKALHEHTEAGHPSIQRDINTIRENQIEQRVVLDGVKATVEGQEEKLDTILKRLPK